MSELKYCALVQAWKQGVGKGYNQGKMQAKLRETKRKIKCFKSCAPPKRRWVGSIPIRSRLLDELRTGKLQRLREFPCFACGFQLASPMPT